MHDWFPERKKFYSETPLELPPAGKQCRSAAFDDPSFAPEEAKVLTAL
jgi:hypothetical protein